MPYLDKEEKFYDYHTSEISGNDIFDTSKTGMSYYDEFIRNTSYMLEEKNLKCEIIQMTPMEYFEGCAKIFDSTTTKQIAQTKADKVTIDHLHQVLSVYKKRFPVTFLNYAEQTQEGRHRMLVAAEYCGWDVKHPVMVITWADEGAAKRKMERERQMYIERKIRDAVVDSLHYTFANIKEFEDELQSQMNRQFNVDFNDPDVEFTFRCDNDNCYVIYQDVSYEFETDSIKIDDSISYDDLDLDDIDLEDTEDIDAWLAKYLK